MTNDEYYGAIRNRSNRDELHSRLPPSMISYAASKRRQGSCAYYQHPATLRVAVGTLAAPFKGFFESAHPRTVSTGHRACATTLWTIVLWVEAPSLRFGWRAPKMIRSARRFFANSRIWSAGK